MRRTQVGKVGKQIAVGPYLVLGHLPVCEDSHEDVTGIVGERSPIAREGCWAGGIIGQHVRQQCPCRAPCLLRRIPVAAWIALAMAGTIADVPISPMPPGGSALLTM